MYKYYRAVSFLSIILFKNGFVSRHNHSSKRRHFDLPSNGALFQFFSLYPSPSSPYLMWISTFPRFSRFSKSIFRYCGNNILN